MSSLRPTNELDSARNQIIRDEAWDVVEEQTFEPDGTLPYRKFFRYGVDERGRQTAQGGSHGEVGQAHAEFSIYDDRGLLAEELTVTSRGVPKGVCMMSVEA